MSDFRELLFESAVRQRNWEKEARMVLAVRLEVARGTRVAVVCADKKQRGAMRKKYPDIAKCFIVSKPSKSRINWIVDDPLFRSLALSALSGAAEEGE